MSRAIIDAREWQKVFDLRTGAALEDVSPLDKWCRGCRRAIPIRGTWMWRATAG